MNTVVETLIGDCNFFFDGEVNFYETMTRDDLFPDNGGFPLDKSHVLHTKHDQMSMSMYAGENVKNGPSASKMSHSRSSSHDTSLILLNDPPLKSSRSNSSLSDTSPTTGSPKLPSRRKPKAPVPPAMTPQPPKVKSVDIKPPMSVPKGLDTSNFSYIDSDPTLHVDEQSKGGGMRRAGSTENILNKPSRPPPVSRPGVANAESQTNSRTIVRQVPLKDKSSTSSSTSNINPRPVAAPRTTTLVKGELEKSEENLLVTMREKPAIPDRPVTLMRPSSFRAATGSGGMGSPTSILNNEKLVEELSATFANKASTNSNAVRRNNSLREGRTSESNGGGDVQSKQVTMYNIEKQQVSIVDVPVSGSPRPVRRELFNPSENDNKENLRSSTDTLNSSDEMKVPPSPRDKIKRPQVPPPARPRSSEGDSTNL